MQNMAKGPAEARCILCKQYKNWEIQPSKPHSHNPCFCIRATTDVRATCQFRPHETGAISRYIGGSAAPLSNPLAGCYCRSPSENNSGRCTSTEKVCTSQAFQKRRSDRCRCAHHCGSRCCPRFFWRTRILCCSSMLRLRPERPGGRLRAGLGGDGRACSSASRSEAEGREKGAVSARRVEILLKGRLLVFLEEVVTHLLSTGERQRRI